MRDDLKSKTATALPSLADDVARRHVPCNLCGSTEREPFCPSNGRGLVQCRRCGLVYVSPRPDAKELYALYGESYFQSADSGTVGYSDYIKDEPNIRRTFARRLERLERFGTPGRVLDVGCATGFFLDVARQRGWLPVGLDVSYFAVQYARDHFGLDARHGSLTEVDIEPGSLDMVTLWDVIEHVPDPKAYLARASELLRSGGLIALATPDVASIPARLTGKKWVGYKLSEEHIYYFAPATLNRMLNDAGFDVVDSYHVGKYVTMRLFLDRLGMYLPWIARPLQAVERGLHLSQRALYVNPYDIVAVTARKR